jgi:polar amino acid transport system substrate-binding protein
LAAGQADALLGSYTYLAAVAATQADLSVILPLPDQQAIGFGLVPGDSYFRHQIDATLQALYTSGRYAELYAKWFPTTPAPTLPTIAGRWPYTLAALPMAVAAANPVRLDTLREQGAVRIGVRYDMPPFGFLDSAGVIQGFEVELAREFAQRWFGDPTAATLVRVTADTAIPLLNAGQVDLLLSALPNTWPTEAAIDLSLPYYADELGILVRRTAPLTTTGTVSASAAVQFGGKTFATAEGVTALAELSQLFDAAAPPLLMPFQEYRTAEQALLAGQIDGVVGSTTVFAQSLALNPALALGVEQLAPQSYAVGIPTAADELRDLVNLTLQVMKLDGSYDTLYAAWFATAPYDLPVWPGITVNTPLALVASSPATATVTGAPTLLPPAGRVSLAPTATPTRTVLLAPPTLPPQTTVTPTTAAPLVTPPVSGAWPVSVTVLSTVNINARTAPTTTAPILSLVSGGTSWSALTLSADNEWVQIALSPTARGWVARRFLVEAAQLAPPATATPVPTPTVLAPVSNQTSAEAALSPTPRLLFATPVRHRVTATDSLASIAQRYYGEQRLWTLIYDANREALGDNPNVLPIGLELVIPPKP